MVDYIGCIEGNQENLINNVGWDGVQACISEGCRINELAIGQSTIKHNNKNESLVKETGIRLP